MSSSREDGQSVSSKGPVKVVILGGVAAGASCATRCRRMNEEADITLVEKGAYVSFANCGIPYYVGNVIPKEDSLLVAKPALFKSRFGIHVLTETSATSIDSSKKTVTICGPQGATSTLEYDYLVLATGSEPIRPPLPGIDDFENLFSVRNIPDARHIKDYVANNKERCKRAVVIGGGFVGLEVAENLVHLGLKVSIVEGLDQIMGPLDSEMAAPAAQVLVNHGVDLHLGSPVAGFEKGAVPGEVVVATKSGLKISGDLVILGIGVRPAARSLIQSAGVKVGERGGIVVDEHMRTSDPSIFAAGDTVESVDVVTGARGIVPLAGIANRQGRIAANSIMGTKPDTFRGVQGTSVCGFFGFTVAQTGGTQKSLTRAGIEHQYIYLHANNHAGYYPGAEQIHMKLLFDPKNGRVLGAQACGAGEGVEKRIDVISMAIQGRMTVFDLEESELCYSPQYGTAKDVVNFAGMIAANYMHGDGITHWPESLEQHQEKAITLIDVRTPGEYERGHAPGSLLAPLDQLRELIASDKLPREKPVHVYCLAGLRGYLAVQILKQHGFQGALNITGGWLSYPAKAPRVSSG